jgi:hypothetical protein
MQAKAGLTAVLVILLVAGLATPPAVAQRPEDLARPAPLPVSIVSVTYVIDGLEVAFHATVEGSPPILYAWGFGDGRVSVEEEPVHRYARAGCYVVILLVSNPYGPDDRWVDTICVGQRSFIPLVIRQRRGPHYEADDSCGDATAKPRARWLNH